MSCRDLGRLFQSDYDIICGTCHNFVLLAVNKKLNYCEYCRDEGDLFSLY